MVPSKRFFFFFLKKRIQRPHTHSCAPIHRLYTDCIIEVSTNFDNSRSVQIVLRTRFSVHEYINSDTSAGTYLRIIICTYIYIRNDPFAEFRQVRNVLTQLYVLYYTRFPANFLLQHAQRYKIHVLGITYGSDRILCCCWPARSIVWYRLLYTYYRYGRFFFYIFYNLSITFYFTLEIKKKKHQPSFETELIRH